MKDQTFGVSIKCFVGWKSKTYTFITKDIHESKIAKCINKAIVDDDLKYEDYKNVFFNRSHMRHDMNRTQSEAHNVGSNNYFLFSSDDRNIYLKMDIVGYYIFIN